MPDNVQTVIDLDKRRMAAMVALDLPVLQSLLADDLIYTHSSAKVDGKQSLIEAMTSGANAYTALEATEVSARDVGGVVIVTGQAAMTVSLGGRPTSFRVRFLDVWVQNDGQWQMIAWQSTRLR